MSDTAPVEEVEPSITNIMWCKTCQISTYEDTCPSCSKASIRVGWFATINDE